MAVTSLPALPFAALPDYPSMGESVLFQLNGLIVVFLALGSIWGLLELMGLFFRQNKPVAAQPVPASSTPADVAPSSAIVSSVNTVSPEVVAVITAAVHVVIAGRPHRIASIVPAPVASEPDWAREGRRTIFASHKTR